MVFEKNVACRSVSYQCVLWLGSNVVVSSYWILICKCFVTLQYITGIVTSLCMALGLKEYSNWPTYPQLYINGELIGGIDIVKELIANGEFQSMLPKEKESQGSLENRLKSLINQKKVMLFMKGSPDTPRCGFSRTIIDILKSKRWIVMFLFLLCRSSGETVWLHFGIQICDPIIPECVSYNINACYSEGLM